MNFQAKNIEQFMQAGEILYALDASGKYGQPSVSKIALQKLMYLSVILAPIKDIILHFLRFQYQIKGPFNSEIQNTVDHLMGLDYVRLVDYDYRNEKRILVSYTISEKGSEAVKRLTRFERESEKHWWISCVTRLAITYSSAGFRSRFSGLNKVVDFVYQDPTFLKNKSTENFRTGIDIGGEEDATKELIDFVKDYIKNSDVKIEERNERRIAEIILVLYFEYLNAKVVTQYSND